MVSGLESLAVRAGEVGLLPWAEFIPRLPAILQLPLKLQTTAVPTEFILPTLSGLSLFGVVTLRTTDP